MTPKRRRELDENPYLVLTYEEYRAGYHFCSANHFDLVGPEDTEKMEKCFCFLDEEED